uniref:Uncharacterized protein n=1 Tax=Arundo donax TaxID=35708 RepID=A0A0A8ZW16_ARUDO
MNQKIYFACIPDNKQVSHSGAYEKMSIFP